MTLTAATAPADGMTMTDMTTAPAHAKPARRDHVWVLAVIAAFALFDVWESWTQVGDKSGFAHGTGWTLTVIVEAYAGYALFAWFDAPGRRSRRFAMWSAFTVLAFSLIGQGSSSVAARSVPPLAVAVFVKDLPVIVLALIAVLIHLRRLDRAALAEAEQESAAARELAAVRAELEAERAALQPLRSELETARNELGRVTAKAELLGQKLARVSGQKRTRKSPPKKAPASTPETAAASPPEVRVPEDVDTQAAALEILAKEPAISGSELGRRLGRTERYGCMLKKALVPAGAPKGQDPEE